MKERISVKGSSKPKKRFDMTEKGRESCDKTKWKKERALYNL